MSVTRRRVLSVTRRRVLSVTRRRVLSVTRRRVLSIGIGTLSSEVKHVLEPRFHASIATAVGCCRSVRRSVAR
jgi:hypothetical protein